MKPADRLHGFRHHALDVATTGHVAYGGSDRRRFPRKRRQALGVDVNHKHLCAIRRKTPGNLPADARRAGRHQNSLRFHTNLRDSVVDLL